MTLLVGITAEIVDGYAGALVVADECEHLVLLARITHAHRLVGREPVGDGAAGKRRAPGLRAADEEDREEQRTWARSLFGWRFP